MRVLYFSLEYSTHDHRFLESLAGSPHEIFFLRLRTNPALETRPLPPQVREVKFSPHSLAPSKPDDWAVLLPEFSRIVAEINPHLVHAGPVQSSAYLAALSGRRPLMVMSWGSDLLLDASRDAQWAAATRTTLSAAQWFVCDCNAVRRRAAAFATFPDDRIVQFPWGVDVRRFAPGQDTLALRRRPGWRDALIVLCTRSWEPVYDLPTLLEAFRLARADEPRLRLVLAGGGSQAEFVENFVRNENLVSDVLLPGRIPNDRLPPWFRAADIYLSCSRTDGSSVSLLEAMATGLPAIVTDIPGNAEWVTDGVHGRLAPAGDAPAFATALLATARQSPEERSVIGARNRQVAETRANWLANFPRLLEAYASIESAHAR